MGDIVQNQGNSTGSKGPYRDIITKAVCGTAKKNLLYTKLVKISEQHIPTKILGTSIHKFELHSMSAEKLNQNQTGVAISGSFEINIWYSYEQGKFTDISREVVTFIEVVPLKDFDGQILNELDTRAMMIKSPECKAAVLQKDHTVRVDVELGIYAEVIGETKLRIRIYKENEEEES